MELALTNLKYKPQYKQSIVSNKWFEYSCLGIGILLISLIIPSIAWGYNIDFAHLDKWAWAQIKSLFAENVNASFYTALSQMKNISMNNDLTRDWFNLFGGDSTIHTILINVSNGAVKPVAGALMSCVFLMQFIKIAGKAESTGTLPMVKDVIYLFVMLAFFTSLITHADDICGALYSMINQISKAISGGQIPQLNPTQDFISAFVDGNPDGASLWHSDEGRDAMAESSIGLMMILWLVFGIASLFGLALSIVITFMVFGRAIQLYLYSMFSPIPFSFLGFEQTRQWGVGFFKNFLCVALSGTIIIVICFLAPYMISAVMGGQDVSQSLVTIVQLKAGGQWGYMDFMMNIGCKVIACYIIFIVGVMKSGSYARDILGG